MTDRLELGAGAPIAGLHRHSPKDRAKKGGKLLYVGIGRKIPLRDSSPQSIREKPF